VWSFALIFIVTISQRSNAAARNLTRQMPNALAQHAMHLRRQHFRIVLLLREITSTGKRRRYPSHSAISPAFQSDGFLKALLLDTN
jgi:hypothetical protein